MTVKNDNYGGTDWVDAEVLWAADLNDTFNETYNPLMAITTSTTTTVYTTSTTKIVTVMIDDTDKTGGTATIYKDYGEAGQAEITFTDDIRVVSIDANITVITASLTGTFYIGVLR